MCTSESWGAVLEGMHNHCEPINPSKVTIRKLEAVALQWSLASVVYKFATPRHSGFHPRHLVSWGSGVGNSINAQFHNPAEVRRHWISTGSFLQWLTLWIIGLIIQILYMAETKPREKKEHVAPQINVGPQTWPGCSDFWFLTSQPYHL